MKEIVRTVMTVILICATIAVSIVLPSVVSKSKDKKLFQEIHTEPTKTFAYEDGQKMSVEEKLAMMNSGYFMNGDKNVNIIRTQIYNDTEIKGIFQIEDDNQNSAFITGLIQEIKQLQQLKIFPDGNLETEASYYGNEVITYTNINDFKKSVVVRTIFLRLKNADIVLHVDNNTFKVYHYEISSSSSELISICYNAATANWGNYLGITWNAEAAADNEYIMRGNNFQYLLTAPLKNKITMYLMGETSTVGAASAE